MVSTLGDFLEDVEELQLGDLAVAVRVDVGAEFLDVLVGDSSTIVQFLEGIVDEILNLAEFEGAALVSIVLDEHSLNSFLELGVGVCHQKNYKLCYEDTHLNLESCYSMRKTL